MKILLSPWMKEMDSIAINEIGIPSIVLMENASRGAAAFFAEEFPLARYKHVVAVIGKGNNGGDGIAVGRILSQLGYSVKFVFLSEPDTLNPDPKINFDIIKRLGLDYIVIGNGTQLEALLKEFHHHDTFLIDAIFGIGINQPLREGIYTDVIRCMNEAFHPVAAIDIPSGLSDAFLPDEGIHIEANATATFQNLKWALLHPDGNKHCGAIRIIDIGIPTQLQRIPDYYINLIEPSDFKHLLEHRPIDAHKGRFGHCLTICGSSDKPGAGILSSISTLKAGAGLCTAAIKKKNLFPMQSFPEIMMLTFNDSGDIVSALEDFDSVLMGPGLGVSTETSDLVKKVLANTRKPVILDADAVNVLEGQTDLLLKKSDVPIILTPHPREFSRLTGLQIDEVLKDRISCARNFAMEYSVYLVLKGHHTIVAAPDGGVLVNQTGNPGMATAGSGDVLAGILAGFMAQFSGRSSIENIVGASVFIHGLAGDIASEKFGQMGMTATDIVDNISLAIRNLDDFRTRFSFS